MRCGEVSSGTWSRMPGFFSRRPPAESMPHIRRAGWRQQGPEELEFGLEADVTFPSTRSWSLLPGADRSW